MTSSAVEAASPRRAGGLRHEALLYHCDEDYVDALLAFVEAGLVAGEPAMLALPGPRLQLLGSRLDDDRVRLADMDDVGRNPGRLLSHVADFVDAHGGDRVRVVGEPIWPGRNSDEVTEAVWLEALTNTALADRNVSAFCPYDADRLPATVLTEVARTHPSVVDWGSRHASPTFTDPATVCNPDDWPLSPPPPNAEVVPVDSAGLTRVRERVRRQAGTAGLGEDRVSDLLIAANEIASNTVVHAGQDGMLRLWVDPQAVICEITDSGRIHDPLAGRRPPSPDVLGGRGLWLAHQICDLVQLRSSAAGTTVRLSIRR